MMFVFRTTRNSQYRLPERYYTKCSLSKAIALEVAWQSSCVNQVLLQFTLCAELMRRQVILCNINHRFDKRIKLLQQNQTPGHI